MTSALALRRPWDGVNLGTVDPSVTGRVCDGAHWGTTVASLNVSAGYVPLLFVNNQDQITPLASRDGSEVQAADVQLFLQYGGVAAGVGDSHSGLAWRLGQRGVDMGFWSWARHCGLTTKCLDSCRASSGNGLAGVQSDGLVFAIFNTKKPDDIGNTLLGFGLIGLYATFIYTISTSLKKLTHKMAYVLTCFM